MEWLILGKLMPGGGERGMVSEMATEKEVAASIVVLLLVLVIVIPWEE